MNTMQFMATCTTISKKDVPLLNAMIDKSKEISRRTFLRYVDPSDMRTVEHFLGYEQRATRGLTMANDWHVAYYRSTWGEQPCVYFTWSAIEHVFA